MIYGFIAPLPLKVTSMNWHPLPATVSTYLIFKYLIISLGSTSNSYEFKFAPLKLFDESKGYKHKNYSIIELIEDNPKHSNKMRSWLSKQNEYLITYEEFKKENK